MMRVLLAALVLALLVTAAVRLSVDPPAASASDPTPDAAGQAGPQDEAADSALEAATFLVQSLRNWSAHGLGGANWLPEEPPHTNQLHHANSPGQGLMSDVVLHSLEVVRVAPEDTTEAPTYRGVLELTITNESALAQCESLLEDLNLAFDKANRDLPTQLDGVEAKAEDKTLSVSAWSIWLEASQFQGPSLCASRAAELLAARLQESGLMTATQRIDQPAGTTSPHPIAVESPGHYRIGFQPPGLTIDQCRQLLSPTGSEDSGLPLTFLRISPLASAGAATWSLELKLGGSADQP